MQNKLFNFLAVLVATTGLQSIAWAQVSVPKDACSDEYARVQDTPQFKAKRKELTSICSFKNSATFSADEKFFLKKWGADICSELMQYEENYVLQCRYRNIIAEGKVNVAEALAISGYTAAYYNYLNPENTDKKPGSAGYEGYDVFNRVLISAIGKLNQYPEFQFNDVSYRGTSLHGRKYKVSEAITKPLNRWNSSSCAKEIAYGPELIEKSETEKEQIIAEAGEDTAGLEYMFMDRDPKSIPQKMNACEEIYFAENPTPPVTPGSHFGDGDLKIIYLPPKHGHSRRVVLYNLSDRRAEAEVLVPIGTRFKVIKVVNPDDPNGDGMNTQVTLEEQ